MTPIAEDLELAIMRERDIRDLAELDWNLIVRAREIIRELPEDSPERDRLIEKLEDLTEIRIHKILRFAFRNDPIDCALQAEITLYDEIRKSRDNCGRELGVNLNGGGVE